MPVLCRPGFSYSHWPTPAAIVLALSSARDRTAAGAITVLHTPSSAHRLVPFVMQTRQKSQWWNNARHSNSWLKGS